MTNPLSEALVAPLAGADRTLLALPDGGHWSAADIHVLSGRLANTLEALGAEPGDRIAVQVEKSATAFALYLACLRAGLVFLPLNTAYTPAEIAYFVGDASPRILVADPAREADLGEIATAHAARLLTLDADGGGTLTDAAGEQASGFPDVPRGRDDLAAILYTSGTTGRAKGAMLTHANLLSNAEALAATWRFTAEDVLLHALPIFHAHGLFVACNVTLLAGARMIFLPRFDADDVIRLLPEATVMMGVPTFYTRLLARDDFTAGRVRHMRLFVSGSAPLLAETHVAFEARTGHRILERYGMTETGMNTSNPYDGERRPGTVGLPLPGVEVRVTDPETGETLPHGETGMVEVRGPNVFTGYWQMPEKTAEEMRPDGFFVTGDLGRFDADGYLTLVGREKDLVISGGFNVYPKEIETAIDAVPGVVESAVIGVPHPDFGEAVVAVVATGETPDADLSEERVVGAIADELARFKQPKRVLFVEELPRNTMGKVQKAELRQRYADLFSAAG